MRVDVEVLHAEPVRLREERQRIDRRALRRRRVVALRPGDAARDLLVRQRPEERRVDAVVDRVADLRVLERALDTPRLADALVLRREPDRVVRLVPRRPHGHLRQRQRRRRVRRVLLPGRRRPEAAVPLGGRVGEVLEILEVRRRDRSRLAAVRPARREEDREDDLDVVLRRVPDEPVVDRPVVGRVARVGRVGRPRLRDGPLGAAPVEVDAEDLRLQRLQRREGGRRVAVERERLVVDADEQVTRCVLALCFFGEAVAADTARPAATVTAVASRAMRLDTQ